MAKILKNITISNILVNDTGISINASSEYTIPPQDYLLWAASSDVITHIGSGDIVVNDGTNDLSKADGVSLLQGNFKQIDFVSDIKNNNGLKVDLSGMNTDNISEGSNLYFTNERAQAAMGSAITAGTQDGVTLTYDDVNNKLDIANTDKGSAAISAHVSEGDPHTQYLFKTDNLLSVQNIVRVKKNPGTGEFLTIEAALASIVDASISNSYVVKVGAGEFIENELIVPPYISVEGESIQSTQVKVAANNHHLFVLGAGCEISFMSLYGLLGSGYAAVYAPNSGNFAQGHKISIYDFDIGILVEATSVDTFFYSEYMDINGDYSYAVKVISSGGFSNITNLENFYAYESTNTNSIGVYAEGTTTDLQLFASRFFCENTQKAIVISNGVNLRCNAVAVVGAEVGLEVLNVGSACTINVISTTMTNNIDDYIISHIGTTGSVSGVAELNKVSVVAGAQIYGLLFDSVDGGIVANGPFYYSEGDFSQLTDISELLVNTPTMGLLEGGELSIDSGLNLAVASGYGYHVRDISGNQVITKREWSNQTISLSASSSLYIYINESGTLTANATFPDIEKNILLGRVITEASSILYMERAELNAHHMPNHLSTMLREAIGPVFVSGCLVSENGTRQLDVTSGKYDFAELQFSPSGGTAITFDAFYQSATPGVYTRVASQTTVSNTQYDDGDGTLGSLGLLAYTKHLLLLVGGPSEKYILIYGTDTYTTLAQAQAASLPTVPSFVKDSFVRIASIIVRQGSNNIQDIIDERPRVGFASSSSVGGVTDHGALSGLTDDDHTQYLLANGSRTMSGSLNMGTNNITNVGTVDGVDVSAHASRHLPNGADPLTTGTPSTLGTANSEGIANAFARQDHVHSHGNQNGGSLHSNATTSVAGFMSGSDKTTVNQAAVFAINNGYGITGGGDITSPRTISVTLSNQQDFDESTTIQTTSTSMTASDISLSLDAGTWFVNYNAVVSATSNGRVISTSLYLNGVLVPGTKSKFRVGSGAGLIGGLLGSTADQGPTTASVAIVVPSTQTLVLRWQTSGGTGVMQERQLTAVRIA